MLSRPDPNGRPEPERSRCRAGQARHDIATRDKYRVVQTGLSRRVASDWNQGSANSLRRLANTLRRLLEEGITAKTKGQGSPNSTHRLNSRLSCGYVKTPTGI